MRMYKPFLKANFLLQLLCKFPSIIESFKSVKRQVSHRSWHGAALQIQQRQNHRCNWRAAFAMEESLVPKSAVHHDHDSPKRSLKGTICIVGTVAVEIERRVTAQCHSRQDADHTTS